MKKIVAIVVAVTLALGILLSGDGHAGDEGWAAAGGFLGGLVVGSALSSRPYCYYYYTPYYYSYPVYSIYSYRSYYCYPRRYYCYPRCYTICYPYYYKCYYDVIY